MWMKIVIILYFSYGVLSAIRHTKEILKTMDLDNATLALAFLGYFLFGPLYDFLIFVARITEIPFYWLGKLIRGILSREKS